ncbi:hypothetical protein [Cerasicoccus maritimus]|uniref:hypothetical protein n=1 Tax=Cerasicoccus maritimus TaxID=490089 RepID=UPI002852A0CB|nr:hypothetical protein [Cerasicoccus maritimus]
MSIEADRQAITELPLTPGLLQSLRESARLHSTHYSTQIECNRLTETQVREVIEGGGHFPGRERDEYEVKNNFKALGFVETEARANVSITETLIRKIHGLAFDGVAKVNPYRDGQNVSGRKGQW